MEVRDQELCRDKVHSLEWSPSCPLDYHKTWDQLKRKYHKKVLCGLSVMYDIETEVSRLPLLTIKRERNL